MIKLSLLKKFGIKLVNGDGLAPKHGVKPESFIIDETPFNDSNVSDERMLTSFTPRLISDGIPTSIDGDVVLELTNGKGLVSFLSARNAAWHVWTTWRPSMEWLVQQAADKPVTYKDDTHHFGEDVQVDLHNVTYVPEGFIRSSASEPAKPIFTQSMADAGELPPVGSEFMSLWDTSDRTYYKGLSIGLDTKGNLVYEYLDTPNGTKVGIVTTTWYVKGKFKPLDTRTEKEKAVDTALALDEYRDGLGMMSRKDFIAKLYDAGLLK